MGTQAPKDPTWSGYDPQYTIKGGVFLNDCGMFQLGWAASSVRVLADSL